MVTFSGYRTPGSLQPVAAILNVARHSDAIYVAYTGRISPPISGWNFFKNTQVVPALSFYNQPALLIDDHAGNGLWKREAG